MARKRTLWKKIIPRKIKVGVSGRFSLFYGSAEWSREGRRRRK